MRVREGDVFAGDSLSGGAVGFFATSGGGSAGDGNWRGGGAATAKASLLPVGDGTEGAGGEAFPLGMYELLGVPPPRVKLEDPGALSEEVRLS